MKQKALRSYDDAEFLAKAGMRFDSAASRAYYALYQAIVAALQEKKVSPGKYTDSNGKPFSRWKHEAILIACVEVLPSQHQWDVQDAFTLRIQADYRPEPVDPKETWRVLNAVDNLLDLLCPEPPLAEK